MNTFERVLSLMFPPKLSHLAAKRERVEFCGGFEESIPEAGILWRGYDVRQTGIEKHFAEERSE